ncbi:hypothetical protein SODALDRAFT_362676 [Sodiomyces alkalinus F11]|uniref:Uncharacterized protein n=1 Tax=Sodiomyces alkalinus (strain CBS 110278 / VKM F-3762 / F11) TaxID=1314773 RepID=A0A3N2PMU0_SODAK|nr:hypothetical protein SODALDRAFT_362676 [Sodiomyces alkalinus F11]ROT35835.1 hypothetical protein SODALDRAFT_362676 [Sodiomyces alkalinus F11]
MTAKFSESVARFSVDQGFLPELGENPGPLDRARHSFAMSLKQNVIQSLLSHISSYTGVLQLSLLTLSFSQEEVQARIRELTDAIRTQMPVLTQRPAIAWDDDETLTRESESFTQEIQAWRLSADDVAAGKSARKNTFPSLVGDGDAESDDFNPEPDRDNGPGRDILIYQKGIALREQLSRPGYDVDFPFAEQAEMQERHADILMACETEEETLKAKIIIQGLLSMEVKQPERDRDPDRLSRLYHKLGDLHFRIDDLPRAQKFLGRALEGRKSRALMRLEDVRVTAELLVKALLRAQAFDEARGLQRWIQ